MKRSIIFLTLIYVVVLSCGCAGYFLDSQNTSLARSFNETENRVNNIGIPINNESSEIGEENQEFILSVTVPDYLFDLETMIAIAESVK